MPTTSGTPSLTSELLRARELALVAGELLLDHERAGVEVEYKGPDDPVTRADREASQIIVTGLQAAFPKDAVLSEEAEDDGARFGAERVWIVDPMDGTREFINKNGEYAVMIGLAIGGVAKLGVVFQPSTGYLYEGVVGHGAWMTYQFKRTAIQVSDHGAGADDALTLAVSRSHRSKRVDQMKKHIPVKGEIVSGSVGLKVGLVIRRSCDAYVIFDDKTKEWDTCGPQAILEAAGGRVTDLHGQPMQYNRKDLHNRDGLVCTNGACHARVMAAVAPVLEWQRSQPES